MHNFIGHCKAESDGRNIKENMSVDISNARKAYSEANKY